MRPLTITREVQIDLAIHTANITRARRDYYAYPITACRFVRCHSLARDAAWCDQHRELRDADRERMRAYRARKTA